MYCNSCGKSARNLSPIEGLLLCHNCRKVLKAGAEKTGTTVKDVWSSMFRRTSRRK